LADDPRGSRLDDVEHVFFVIRLLLDQHSNVLSGTLISEKGEREEAFRSLDQVPQLILSMLATRGK
jgi:hypothetical protein